VKIGHHAVMTTVEVATVATIVGTATAVITETDIN
jgi:hypothetical protein